MSEHMVPALEFYHEASDECGDETRDRVKKNAATYFWARGIDLDDVGFAILRLPKADLWVYLFVALAIGAKR